MDSAPCLYSFTYGLRVCLLTLTVAILSLIVVCSLIVNLYKEKRVRINRFCTHTSVMDVDRFLAPNYSHVGCA